MEKNSRYRTLIFYELCCYSLILSLWSISVTEIQWSTWFFRVKTNLELNDEVTVIVQSCFLIYFINRSPTHLTFVMQTNIMAQNIAFTRPLLSCRCKSTQHSNFFYFLNSIKKSQEMFYLWLFLRFSMVHFTHILMSQLIFVLELWLIIQNLNKSPLCLQEIY